MSERRARWALVGTSLGFGVVQLDVSAVNVAIRPIGAALGGGVTGLQWVVNAYTLTLASFLLSAGALGDRIGARRVFVTGFAIFAAASAACGAAPDLAVLIAARAVQGTGAAVLIPCSLALLTHSYPDAADRARAIGIWLACASVALSAGPLVGGLLTDAFGWRAIFFINPPLALAGIALTARFARETPAAPGRGIDAAGQLAGVVTLGALAAATVTGGRSGFTTPLVLAGYALAAVAATAFVVIEKRVRRPLLPLELFRLRVFRTATSIGLLVNVAFYGLIFVLSLYFQLVRGYGVLATGLAFAPTTVAVGVANLLAARLTRRFGERTTGVAAAAVVAAATAGLLVASRSTSFAALVVQLAVLGVALGVVVPVITAAQLESVEASRSGLASGVLNSARQTGSVVGVALFGSLAASSIITGLRESILVSAGLAVAAALLALALPRRP